MSPPSSGPIHGNERGNSVERHHTGILAILAVGALVVGCASSPPASAPAATPGGSAGPSATSSQPRQEWIKPAEQELAKQFEQQTGIHVDYQILPADLYFNVLKTKLNSGEAAEIFGGQAGKSDLKVQYDVETNAVDLTRHSSTGLVDECRNGVT